MERIPMTVSGGCQCGAVRYRTTALLDNSHICHCRMCQKAVGNFFAALVGTPNDELIWTRGTPSVFASSDLADRGFCANCGTPLFYRGKDSPRTGLTIGSLDDPSVAPPHVQVGMEGRYAFMDGLCALPDMGATEDDMAEEAPVIRASNHQHPDHDTEHWPPGMTITVHGIPNCDTVKKARKWLDEHEVAYDFRDYKKAPPSEAELAGWAKETGWEPLLNKAGTTFRKLPDADKTDIDEAKAVALMAANPSTIKRPVVTGAGNLLVGFKPELWAERFA